VVPASIVVAAAAAEVPGPVRVVDVVPFQLLLVEDNDINQTVALGILTQLGYQVDIAADGIQAVAMAAQHAYDAILMDCQMPRLDGYAATIEIRKRPATRATPIIAMTAATFAADRLRCFDSGMDDFIAKPVRAATLQATLNRWLRPDPSSPQSDSDSGSGSGSDASGSEASSSEGSGSGDVGPETPGAEAVRFAKAVPEPRAEQVVRAEVAERAEAAQLRAARWPQAQPEVSARRPADTRIEAPPVPMPVGGIGESAGTEQRIRELLGGGSQIEIDLVHEIISSFLSRTVDLFQLLTLAVAARDADAVHLHAHSMAGAGLNLGTVQVAQISRQIEADAKAGRPALSVPRLVELQLALDQARIILRDLAANLPAAPPEG
jgi:CheY-like chemotaxis protein/HPt (histidine-containing phosphotransfer) domain-containing protein